MRRATYFVLMFSFALAIATGYALQAHSHAGATEPHASAAITNTNTQVVQAGLQAHRVPVPEKVQAAANQASERAGQFHTSFDRLLDCLHDPHSNDCKGGN